MFDDINLLPEDLRDKERKEKEKIEKSGGSSDGELSYPFLEEKKGDGFDFKDVTKKEKKAEWEVKGEGLKEGKPGFIGKKRKKSSHPARLDRARKPNLFERIKKIFKRKKIESDLKKIKKREIYYAKGRIS
jgi:hypothetical protein